MPLDYKILTKSDPHELEKEVREALKQGWDLYGDLQVSVVPPANNAGPTGMGRTFYHQAMTK